VQTISWGNVKFHSGKNVRFYGNFMEDCLHIFGQKGFAL